MLDVVEVQSWLGERDNLDGREQMKPSTLHEIDEIAPNSNHAKSQWLPSMIMLQFINLATKFH